MTILTLRRHLTGTNYPLIWSSTSWLPHTHTHIHAHVAPRTTRQGRSLCFPFKKWITEKENAVLKTIPVARECVVRSRGARNYGKMEDKINTSIDVAKTTRSCDQVIISTPLFLQRRLWKEKVCRAFSALFTLKPNAYTPPVISWPHRVSTFHAKMTIFA